MECYLKRLYPNIEISKSGNVYSLGYYGKKRGYEWHQLSKYTNAYGYYQFNFKINGYYTGKQQHRMLAEAFIPNPDNKPCVNHINGIKTDNRLENLEWCTFRENTIHAITTGLFNPYRKWELEGANITCDYCGNASYIKGCLLNQAERKGYKNKYCNVICMREHRKLNKLKTK